MFIVSSRIQREAKTAAFISGQPSIGTRPFHFICCSPLGDLVVERVGGHWCDDAPWSCVAPIEISKDAAHVAGLLSGRINFVN